MGKKIQFIGRYALEGQLLGKGSFARVELAHHSVTGCKVAIKIIDTRKLKEEYQKNNLHREARILGQLRHPNIIRLYETLKATTLHCLVLEYAAGGELQAFIKLQKDFRLSEDRARPYVRQLVSALHYLHERGVAHRDLKMENIMLDNAKVNVKLVDFGLSNTFSKDELMKTHCGSPEYAAPELFTAGEKYGLEIDIWSFGIVLYAMLVGKLPFTTPYTDQYRRQKLVQQMERGLVDMHNHEMSHLSLDCQDLIHRVIEPSPSLRLPLLDMEIHPWFTDNGKKPFFPFLSFPRDKGMKTQTYEELAGSLGMRKEVLEQKVAENKSDELSAMFNMILDKKRQQQGVFDVDHTSERREAKGKRSKSAHTKHERVGDRKHAHRGPPALILPADDHGGGESAPHSGNEPDHETKFSSFDFLALCSTPTWLGPERRKSRRRSRSPMPSPHLLQHGNTGDYMERQALEMERELIREERAAAAGNLSPSHDGQQPNGLHMYGDQHNQVNASLSVPGSDSMPQSAFSRSSSFKLSRRRARSCGPSHRRKGSYRRSGSVDHQAAQEGGSQLPSMLTSSKDGRSAPAIAGDSILVRGSSKTASLKMRRNSACVSSSSVAHRKRSVDFVDTTNRNNFLGVPNNDAHRKNFLTVPPTSSSSNLLRVSEVGVDGRRNLLQVPNAERGSNPLLCVSQHEGRSSSLDRGSVSMSGGHSSILARPGKLTLKECYSPPQEVASEISARLLLKPVISGANGPLTSVEVHCGNQGSYRTSEEDLVTSSFTAGLDPLHVLRDSKGASSSSRVNSICVDTIEFLRTPALDKPSSPAPFHLWPVPPAKSKLPTVSNNQREEGAVAMQIEDQSNVLSSARDQRCLLGAEGPLLKCPEDISDLDHHFSGMLLSSDCLEESEDRVDSMTELISSSFRDEVIANVKASMALSLSSASDAHRASRHNSITSPEEDIRLKGSGSLASFSKSSASGKKSSGGKAKSPTTPLWLNLRTPLARIESFHSDDFECFADSDNDEQSNMSSASATTPTVPCFAYKLHVLKKKQTKLKSGGKSRGGVSCPEGGGGIAGGRGAEDYLSSKVSHNSVDKQHSTTSPDHARLDAAATDPLLSSGSDTEHHEYLAERLGVAGKSRIHPMGADDGSPDLLSRNDGKSLSYQNAITKQPQIKNSVNKLPKILPEVEHEAKKKAFVKHLAWRKSFAQFLKRKRYHRPLMPAVEQQPPQQQQQQQQQQNQQIHGQHHHNQLPQQNQQIHRHPHQPQHPNNNNNELTPLDTAPESRNGILPRAPPPNKTMELSTGVEDLVVTSQEEHNFKLAATTLSPIAVESVVSELIELQSSPKPQCPPSPSQAFDFSLATDSPKMKSSCLIGWGTCGDCGQDEVSSEEEMDYINIMDPMPVTMKLKPFEQSLQGNLLNSAPAYSLSPT